MGEVWHNSTLAPVNCPFSLPDILPSIEIEKDHQFSPARRVQTCWLEMNSNLWCHFPGWAPLDRLELDKVGPVCLKYLRWWCLETLSLDVRYFVWKILLIHHNNQDLISDNLIKPFSKFRIIRPQPSLIIVSRLVDNANAMLCNMNNIFWTTERVWWRGAKGWWPEI